MLLVELNQALREYNNTPQKESEPANIQLGIVFHRTHRNILHHSLIGNDEEYERIIRLTKEAFEKMVHYHSHICTINMLIVIDAVTSY